MANKPTDVFKKINMHGGDITPCWEWLGGHTGEGRPCYDLHGKKVTAYKLVYELFHGVKVPAAQLIRHKCDNGGCCNPHHLELGSHQENMDDMKKRERHGLPAITVKAIRKLLEQAAINKAKGVAYETHDEIAEKFGVDRSTVGRIDRGETSRSKVAD